MYVLWMPPLSIYWRLVRWTIIVCFLHQLHRIYYSYCIVYYNRDDIFVERRMVETRRTPLRPFSILPRATNDIAILHCFFIHSLPSRCLAHWQMTYCLISRLLFSLCYAIPRMCQLFLHADVISIDAIFTMNLWINGPPIHTAKNCACGAQ